VTEIKKWFQNYDCQNQGGMCYRHNLAGLEGGPRARWAQRIIVMGLRIGSCASGLRPGLAVYLDRCMRLN
jgi:hypothetical protein